MGIISELAWTPGHAEIRGNELADQLAKEAATEAKEIGPENLPAITTMQEIKMAARKHGSEKWQERWDMAETGRHLYEFRPQVGYHMKHNFKSVATEKVVSQLRTGYVFLNEYLHSCKLGNTLSPMCECGEPESVRHYLLSCPRYDTQREILRKSLFTLCGIVHLDCNILLNACKEDPEGQGSNRDMILTILETYVVDTGRFTTLYKF